MTRSREASVLYEFEQAVAAILQEHNLDGDDATERLESRITKQFERSLLALPTRMQLHFLKKHIPNQAERARIVGVSRSALSRIEKKGVMLPKHILAVYQRFPQLKYPPREECAHEAAVSTITYVQRRELNRLGTGALTREEYEILHELIADRDWLEAQQTDSMAARKAAFDKIRKKLDENRWIKTQNVQTYFCAEYLLECWRDAFLVGVYFIPFEAESEKEKQVSR